MVGHYSLGKQLMHRFTLFLLVAPTTTLVNAASYQKIDGTVIDPIQATQDGALVYSDYSGHCLIVTRQKQKKTHVFNPTIDRIF